MDYSLLLLEDGFQMACMTRPREWDPYPFVLTAVAVTSGAAVIAGWWFRRR